MRIDHFDVTSRNTFWEILVPIRTVISMVKWTYTYEGAPECWRRSQKPGVSDQTFPPPKRLAHETKY